MTEQHVAAEVLARYAASATQAATAGADTLWLAVEVHLERCATCRARLRTAVESSASPLATQLQRVRGELVAYAAAHPVRPPRRIRLPRRVRRWARSWVAPALLPRLGMTALVVSAALVLDLADQASQRFPSLVLLLAPVLPLLGVAAAWSQRLDPAYELVVGSPRAGLDLVLRRAVVALFAAIGLLSVAGGVLGYSPARWLLPCLAFTVAALALGGFIGLNRAVTLLAVAWGVLVVGPSLVVARSPAVLAAQAMPGWLVATCVVGTVVLAHRRGFVRLVSGR